MKIDPKTERDTQILLPLQGKCFGKMTTTIRVTPVETATRQNAEEVAEQLVVWLKEREQYEEYARPNVRSGSTPQGNCGSTKSGGHR